jgi:hypothetical protein
VQVVARPLLTFTTVEELVDTASQCLDLDHAYSYYLGKEQRVNLTLRTGPDSDTRVGRFKRAQFGDCEPVLRLFSNSSVCAKQAVHQKSSSGAFIPYEGRKQLRELLPEIQCLAWATTLHDSAMQFVQDKMAETSAKKTLTDSDGSPIEIPRMRFVEAYIAKEDLPGSTANTASRVFLLEEVIDTATEGGFRKYINNNSAKPLEMFDEESMIRAEFLAFTQHYQYWYTRKIAFVTDFQGNILFFSWNIFSLTLLN